MLFFRESYRHNGAHQGTVNSIEEWAKITGEDYQTPQLRQVRNSGGGDIAEVLIPLLPARAKDREGYTEEFIKSGFDVEKFIEMDASTAIPHSASIYVRKGKESDINLGLDFVIENKI